MRGSVPLFLGASPLGTALLLSLLLSLAILSVARAALYLGPLLRRQLEKSGVLDLWFSRFGRLNREFQVLLLGLVAVSLGVSAVAYLAEGVTSVPAVSDWDQDFVVAAHAHIDTFEVKLFETTTSLAGRLASWILGLGVSLFLLVRGKQRLLLLWVVGVVGNSIIIQLLKQAYQRPRPTFAVPLLTETNFSFPSGHASASILMYGLLAYILFRSTGKMDWKGRIALVIGVLWVGVFIGTSRLALGVHYPTDVLAGWSVAITWLAVLVTADLFIRPRRSDYPTERIVRQDS
jgi:membrane-associated phospholipid phosphatase